MAKGYFEYTNYINPKRLVTNYSFAATHVVESLIYYSFSFLDESQLPPQSLRLQWAVRMDQIERHNRKMNEPIALQYTSFTKQGIQPLLQKGQGVAACYIKPLHRISGDIDWYFEDNGYTKAREYLKLKKINFQDTAGFNLDYQWNHVDIEHHKRLFDIKSPFKYSYLKSIETSYKDRYQEFSINNVTIKVLAPELQVLQVNAHILKHMISLA